MEQTRCQSFAHPPSRSHASDSRPLSAFLPPHSGEGHCETAPSGQTLFGPSLCPPPKRVDDCRHPHKKAFPVRMRKQRSCRSQTQSDTAIQPSHSPRFPLHNLRSCTSHPGNRVKNHSSKKLNACFPAALDGIAICCRQPPFYCHLPPPAAVLLSSAAAFWDVSPTGGTWKGQACAVEVPPSFMGEGFRVGVPFSQLEFKTKVGFNNSQSSRE